MRRVRKWKQVRVLDYRLLENLEYVRCQKPDNQKEFKRCNRRNQLDQRNPSPRKLREKIKERKKRTERREQKE